MLIGELSKKSGFSRDTIRYYEKMGLVKLKGTKRLANNYKQYSEAVLKRLQTIEELKGLGFTLREIKEMLDLREKGLLDCQTNTNDVLLKIQDIEEQIEKLQKIRQHLMNILSLCPDPCQIMLLLDKGIQKQ